MFQRDFEVQQAPPKSDLRAKMTFLNQFSHRFGHILTLKRLFPPQILVLNQNQTLFLESRNILGILAKKLAEKFGFMQKLAKKTAILTPFLSQEILEKKQNYFFQGHSGSDPSQYPESTASQNYKNHTQVIAKCCPLQFDDVIGCPTPPKITHSIEPPSDTIWPKSSLFFMKKKSSIATSQP